LQKLGAGTISLVKEKNFRGIPNDV
jgi:hypothetical protein